MGFGADFGINGTLIEPKGPHDFLINDFAGDSMELSGSVSTPIGGGGYTHGGTLPSSDNGPLDRFLNLGTGPRGYTTGSVTPELSLPEAKVSAGVIITKSKSVIWDF